MKVSKNISVDCEATNEMECKHPAEHRLKDKYDLHGKFKLFLSEGQKLKPAAVNRLEIHLTKMGFVYYRAFSAISRQVTNRLMACWPCKTPDFD